MATIYLKEKVCGFKDATVSDENIERHFDKGFILVTDDYNFGGTAQIPIENIAGIVQDD